MPASEYRAPSRRITADNKSKAYGAPLPPLTVSYSGWVNSEGPGSLGTPLTVTTTHARPVSFTYVTVAVGRDYADVSPTCGTFRAPTGGWLSSRESVRLTAVGYD